MLQILTWNIKACQTADQIAYLTAEARPDVLVLTEYRQLMRDDRLSAALHQAGWIYQHTPVTQPKVRGVLIASRIPLDILPPDTTFDFGALAGELSPRVARISLPAHDLTLIGVYMPFADGPAKEALWAALNAYARAHSSERYVITGDLNSSVEGESEGQVYTPGPLKAIREVAIDAWAEMAERYRLPKRERYTWYSKTKYGLYGIRLDYAFLSPALREQLVRAHHDHTVRLAGLSDHSALFIGLAL